MNHTKFWIFHSPLALHIEHAHTQHVQHRYKHYMFLLLLHVGLLVPPLSPSDYHVVLFTGSSSVTAPNETTVVTTVWLESCLDEEKLVCPHSHFLFTPLPVAVVNSVLSGCVLAFRFVNCQCLCTLTFQIQMV